MSVQLENGFARIANEILENIARAKLTATQYELILVIWRFTYGFSRKEHNLSTSFLSRATSRDGRQVQRALKDLESRKIIKQVIGNNKRMISFNKNFSEWVCGIGISTYGNSTTWAKYHTGNGDTTIGRHGKTTIQERKKENIKETERDFSSQHSADTKKEYEDYFVKVWGAYPNKKGKNKISNKQKQKLYKEIPEAQMLQAIEKYKQEKKGVEQRFIMHGSTWFNGGYEDYIDPVKAPPGPKKEPVYRDYHEKMAELEAAELERLKSKSKVRIIPYEDKMKELEEAELRRLTHANNTGT